MATSPNTPVATWLVLLLAVVNLGTLGFFFWDANKDVRGPNPTQGPITKEGGPARFIIETLAFTPAQQDQFEELKHEHQHQMHEQAPKMRKVKEELYAVLNADNLDEGARGAALGRVAAQQRMMDSITLAHFWEVKKLCTPAQAAKFSLLTKELPRLMKNEGRGRGGPRP